MGHGRHREMANGWYGVPGAPSYRAFAISMVSREALTGAEAPVDRGPRADRARRRRRLSSPHERRGRGPGTDGRPVGRRGVHRAGPSLADRRYRGRPGLSREELAGHRRPVIYMFAPQVRTARPADPEISSHLVAAAYAIVLLITVLIHEVAHALVAVRARYQVRHIVVHLLGGHTIYDSTNNRPGASALVAVSGPAANFALAGICHLAAPAVPWEIGELLLNAATLANVFVGGSTFSRASRRRRPSGRVTGLGGDEEPQHRAHRGRLVRSSGHRGRPLLVPRPPGPGRRPSRPTASSGSGSSCSSSGAEPARQSGVGRSAAVRERAAPSTLLRPIRLARHTDSVAAIAPWLGEATVVVIGADQHPLGIVDPRPWPRSRPASGSQRPPTRLRSDSRPVVVQADPPGTSCLSPSRWSAAGRRSRRHRAGRRAGWLRLRPRRRGADPGHARLDWRPMPDALPSPFAATPTGAEPARPSPRRGPGPAHRRQGRMHTITLSAGRSSTPTVAGCCTTTSSAPLTALVVTNTAGMAYLALRPLLADYVMSMPSRAAVVYPKDPARSS